MTEAVDRGRRRLLWRTALAMGAAHTGMFGAAIAEGASRQMMAIGRAGEWLNSPRLSPDTLAGKIVIVQFCTYTCINWLRTLPYVRAWAEKYQKQLVLIGVHTPEFSFEHEVDNVRRAVRQLAIDYPIAIDNDYAIWRAFDNHYWPALYFIDSRGRVRHQHFGEGDYEQSERFIQRLLTEAGARASDRELVRVHPTGVEVPASWQDVKSPEHYVGHQRTANFTSPEGMKPDRHHRYTAPRRFALNQWALVGDWTARRERIVSSAPGARIVNRFHARDLHLVLGPSPRGTRARFRVAIDGKPPGAACGVDVDESGSGTIVEPRLYQLIRQPRPIVDRQFEIEFLDAGAEAYAFTFG